MKNTETCEEETNVVLFSVSLLFVCFFQDYPRPAFPFHPRKKFSSLSHFRFGKTPPHTRKRKEKERKKPPCHKKLFKENFFFCRLGLSNFELLELVVGITLPPGGGFLGMGLWGDLLFSLFLGLPLIPYWMPEMLLKCKLNLPLKLPFRSFFLKKKITPQNMEMNSLRSPPLSAETKQDHG